MTARILTGDCRAMLGTLDADSVHCVVTSPPYWGLRDYGFDGQIGLEPTLEEWVAEMVAVFREVKRVLRPDGVCWVNLGDAFSHDGACGGESPDGPRRGRGNAAVAQRKQPPVGLPPKNLLGQPWRVAFALQADGWYLRSDVIWSKPNPMPESVKDRPTKAHEYVFLLTKAARYFYDADAVREAQVDPTAINHGGGDRHLPTRTAGGSRPKLTESIYNPLGRNLRTVWTIPTQPYPEAHFATFPEALVDRCVRAGTSEKGCCATCGAPWGRVTTRETTGRRDYGSVDPFIDLNDGRAGDVAVQTTGWRPTCNHDAPTAPCTVLDPFAGTGTVGVVAHRNGCNSVLIEANPEYVKLMRRRLDGVIRQPMLFESGRGRP